MEGGGQQGNDNIRLPDERLSCRLVLYVYRNGPGMGDGPCLIRAGPGFLRHFSGLVQETLAVPISGEHAGRPAEEVVPLIG